MCFLKRKFSYISGKGNSFLKSLYLGGNLQCLKNKQKSRVLKKFFVSYDVFVIFTSAEQMEISC